MLKINQSLKTNRHELSILSLTQHCFNNTPYQDKLVTVIKHLPFSTIKTSAKIVSLNVSIDRTKQQMVLESNKHIQVYFSFIFSLDSKEVDSYFIAVSNFTMY